MTDRSRDEIVFWSLCNTGQEICGFLVDDLKADRHFVAMRNSSSTPHHVEITRKEWLRVLRNVGDLGWLPVAFVHSHLGTARPSTVDLENARSSELPWLIVSVSDQGLDTVALVEPTGG
jgi:proteasome lid subunit RPN8/RPN11